MPCSQIGRLNSISNLNYYRFICKFNVISIKVPTDFGGVGLRKMWLSFVKINRTSCFKEEKKNILKYLLYVDSVWKDA